MNRYLPCFLAALLCLLPLTACRSNREAEAPVAAALGGSESPEPEAAAGEKLKVVTTIFPPYDFVREVAGDRVELTMLLSPGAESHSYDPSPRDIIAIQDSDIFIYIGGETDLWVERILDSVDKEGMTILSMLDMVEAVEEEIVEGMEAGHDHEHDDEDHDHEEDEDHDEGHHDEEERERDEHVWTSPKNAALIVRELSSHLSRLDEGNRALYEANTQRYVAELDELDEAFREMVDGAARRTVVFGDRFPFRYLADAYDLEYYAAFPGCSTETEASASTVAFLINKVRDEGIPVVFHIELSNEKMADTICAEAGANKLLLHSVHNVTRDDFQAGVTYLSLMRQNIENLREALYG